MFSKFKIRGLASVTTIILVVGALSVNIDRTVFGQAKAKSKTVGNIYTVAGNCENKILGDGGKALLAPLNSPSGTAFDSEGNLYIVSSGGNAVRKVDKNGIITTVAGNGKMGYSGDNGLAINATFCRPEGIAIDKDGNLYISDYGNNVVRKIEKSSGIISTVAGNKNLNYPAPIGDEGPATSALIRAPRGLAIDSQGNMFICDSYNNAVRKVDTKGIITTFVGNEFVGTPSGIAIDPLGNIYIADRGLNEVLRIDTKGAVSTFAGNRNLDYSSAIGDGGPAIKARLVGPTGVTLDKEGNVFICELFGNVVRKVDKTGTITTVAGSYKQNQDNSGYEGDGGAATSALLSSPEYLAIDKDDNIIITDNGNNLIRKVDKAGIITSIAGNGSLSLFGDNSEAVSASFSDPYRIAADAAGNLYISDSGNNAVRKIDTKGVITTVAGHGIAGYKGDKGPATSAELNFPDGVTIDKAGNLYICDQDNNVIRKVDTAGIITTIAGNGKRGYSGDGKSAIAASLAGPEDIAIDSVGNIYICDTGNNVIRKVDTNGIITTVAGKRMFDIVQNGDSATSIELKQPDAIALDASGNLYIGEWRANDILKVDVNGKVTKVAGNGHWGYSGDGGNATDASFEGISELTIDKAGNMFICDCDNDVIRKIDTNGIISTITGNAEIGREYKKGCIGDGGPAASALIYNPTGVELDPSGNLYIADVGNNVIREIVYLADSSIDTETAVFDKYSGSTDNKDLTLTLNLNGNTLPGISNGDYLLKEGTDYKVSGSSITISKNYLSSLPVGQSTFTFKFSAGLAQTLVVNITDSAPNDATITSNASSFDKYSGSANNKDLAVTLNLKGNILSGIFNGKYMLKEGSDYTVSGNKVTISKAYLSMLPEGKLTLTFKFSSGTDQILTLQLVNTTPVNPAVIAQTSNLAKTGSAINTETLFIVGLITLFSGVIVLRLKK